MSLGNKSEYLHPGNLKISRLFNTFKSLLPRNSGRLSFFPRRYNLDPSSACNLKCAYCFHSRYNPETDIAPGLLSRELFKKIFPQISPYAMMLEFYNWGEPTLNPHLPEMIAAAAKKGIRSRISSNLSAPVSDEYLERLVKSGLYRLTGAIDGHTQKIYEKYRAGGNLETVFNNSRKIIRIKQKLGLSLPVFSFRMLVFEWNHDYIEETRKTAETLGFDEFHAQPASYILDGKKVSWSISDKKWIELKPKFSDTVPEKSPSPCPWLFSTLLINHDGSTIPCCYTSDKKHLHLSLSDHSLEKVWNSDQYQMSRLFTLGLSKDRSGVLPSCHNCRLL